MSAAALSAHGTRNAGTRIAGTGTHTIRTREDTTMSTPTTTLTEAQAEQIRVIVLDVLELEDDELTLESHFVDDHGADSLLAIEILARIERDLGVVIPQDDLVNLTTLENVNAIVARIQAGGEHA
jgi:acyl carrier protein